MRRFWITILVYAILGPPLGLAMGATFGMLVAREISIPSILFLYGSYLFGEVPALIAGAWVATSDGMRLRSLIRIGLIMGLVPGLLLTGANIPNRQIELNEAFGLSLAVPLITLMFLVPTIVCGLVARTFFEDAGSSGSQLALAESPFMAQSGPPLSSANAPLPEAQRTSRALTAGRKYACTPAWRDGFRACAYRRIPE